jgi:hypothetical protein
MIGIRFLAGFVLFVPLTPAAACPWHGDMFAEPGGYMMEPVGGGPTDLQAPQPATAKPALSREELMARQRELFLARYPQLAVGASDKPAEPKVQPAGDR